MNKTTISIIGCGNIGSAMATGFINSKKYLPNEINLTKRKIESLKELKQQGFKTSTDNKKIIKKSKIIILSVGPNHLIKLLHDIASILNDNHIIISVVSGIEIKDIQKIIGTKIPIIRAMPNTAASSCESLTCLSSSTLFHKELKLVESIFNTIGKTLIIDEEKMSSATALCACGVAFFLRAIRAASQGGIEIGFHSDEAFKIAAQTARGAATLLLENFSHPESEIDKVTTPMGATIAGLNEMEHQGFSSSMIKGIITSTKKVNNLYKKN